jgi:hypothetical protein
VVLMALKSKLIYLLGLLAMFASAMVLAVLIMLTVFSLANRDEPSVVCPPTDLTVK